MTQDPYRLPTTIKPRTYTLTIRPDLDAATFAGDVTIDMDVTEPTDQVTLNALDLVLDQVTVNDVPVAAIDIDEPTERATFTLDERLPVGPATLHASFSGILNDKLMGFYRSTFDLTDLATGSTEQHTIAVTQFESTHARAAFPCFDEPAMKATFRISLVIDENLFAVSNGAETSRAPLGDGTVRIDFAETMPMSTYLVAFVVGPLTATEPRMVQGSAGPIPLRIVHRPGSERLCDFALDVAEAALVYFENYYGILYPGDKVDLVAVPDFAFGAMENLGCVTFREVLLLIDPDSATQPELQRVADVINHELAHMWFGDLVTMKWWNGIWLNEAFATFMENMASDSFNPSWDVWTTFGLARATAFDTDSLSTTRPIEYEVISPADSEGMFDVLTYEKGASVVRMLEQYLGAETFRQGISSYLTDHSYGVTETTDLWDALEQASGEPVRRIMDGWIFRGGHPSVSVATTDSGVRLTQERFCYQQPDGGTVGADTERWAVPMSVRYRLVSDESSGAGSDVGSDIRRLLLEDDTELDLGGTPTMVQVNAGGTGFFRTDLDAGLLMALAADPDSTPLERFVMLDDACAAMNAGRLTAEDVWSLLEIVGSTEVEPAVWRRIAAALRELHRLSDPASRSAVAERVLKVTGPGLGRAKAIITAEPRTALDEELGRAQEIRGIMASLRGTIGEDDHVQGHAAQIFAMDPAAAASDSDAPVPSLDASLRAAAIEVVGYNATPEQHTELIRRWREASTPQDELRHLTALVDTGDPALFGDALAMLLSEVRSQNAPYVLQRAIGHRSLASEAWDFVEGNWDQLIDRFPVNSLPRMLAGIRAVTDERLADRISDFLSRHELAAGQQQVDQHLERMRVTVASAARVRGS